ncbi:MAG: MATE family efflux transporter [Bacillota bacterium]
MSSKVQSLGENNINKLIAEYSIPSIIGMLVMASYNIIDRIFVGRGVGTLAISGIAITFPLSIIIMGFAQMVGMGAIAIISIRLGEKKKEEAEKTLENALLMSVVLSLLLSGSIYLFMRPLLTFLGATGEVYNYAVEYSTILIYGIPFSFILFSLNGIMRSEGKPKMALSTMLISGILNMILNPFFIMVLHMGVRGSALATVIAQFVGAAWVLFYYTGSRSLLKLRRMSFDRKIAFNVISIGFSPLIMQIAGSFIFFMYNRVLLQYGGDVAIAAMSICFSIMTMIMMPIFGLNQGIQPIIGYNYGAMQIGRVKETFRKGIILATAICIVGFLIILFFSVSIMHIFNTNDEKLIDLGARSLRIFLITLPISGFQIVSWAYFQAVGKPAKSMILTVTKQILFIIPLIIILPRYAGLNGILIAGPISDLLAAILTGVLLLIEAKRLRNVELSPVQVES